MSRISFRLKNLKKFNKSLDNAFKRGTKTNVKRAVFNSANAVRNTAIESIRSGNKSGRIYKRGDVIHRASAPGEAPATDTGFLINQITTEVKTKKSKVIGQIIASAPYAKHLEFGTSNMMARPYMQPALDKNKDKIKSIFKREGVIK